MINGQGSQQIEKLRQQLDGWRGTNNGRKRRIPEGYWRRAAELVERFGVHKIAKALRLDYYDLKERRDGLMLTATGRGERAERFVEVVPAMQSAVKETVIELRGSARVEDANSSERLVFAGCSNTERGALED